MRKRLEHIANNATSWIGSIESLIIHTLVFLSAFIFIAFGVSLEKVLAVLTNLLSLEAIYLAIFIQMSVNQNTQRLNQVETNIGDIAEDVDGIEQHIDEIAENVEEIAEDVEGIEKEVTEIGDNVDEIAEDVEGIQEDVEGIEKDIDEIQENVEEIEKDMDIHHADKKES